MVRHFSVLQLGLPKYMSNTFIKFTDECGIHRHHTTQNRPQQNGVTERANCTMADDISAMLFEAKLPPSLWGEALSAQIHVWNCLPTSSLKGTTPYEAWFKRKPNSRLGMPCICLHSEGQVPLSSTPHGTMCVCWLSQWL